MKQFEKNRGATVVSEKFSFFNFCYLGENQKDELSEIV